MKPVRALFAASLVALIATSCASRADAAEGQMTWGVHISLAPSELDVKRREALLHRIQQLVHEKAMTAPIWLNAGMNGLGRRVEESGIGLIPGYIFSAPYEDVKLKGQ